jgi:hypothetical protein
LAVDKTDVHFSMSLRMKSENSCGVLPSASIPCAFMAVFMGNIVMILDFADPMRPREVGRWWMPGQWIAGGETPNWKGLDWNCLARRRIARGRGEAQ